MTRLVPLHPQPGGRGGFEQDTDWLLPFFGSFLLLALLLAGLTALYLWRQGKLTLPGFASAGAPEADARRILAERFARGDIGSDEFMERASMLNWTPGAEAFPSRPRRNGR
jgi:putative membrane protein